MSKKKVLGIFAHCDDEVLFGWPIFQSNEFEKHLIICCDNAARKDADCKKALQNVCHQENIILEDCLSEDNNFYALPTRRADFLLTDAIQNIEAVLEREIKYGEPDFIFTHNPVGEYGHGSHRLLFEIVSQNKLVKNLLITNICQESNHRSSKYIPSSVFVAYYRNASLLAAGIEQLDIDFYNRCKQIYDRHNAWSWNQEPVSKCRLHLLKEQNG